VEDTPKGQWVGDELSRRELLVATAGIAIGLSAVDTAAARPAARTLQEIDFAARPAREGWGKGWRSMGVANLRCVAGEGLLEAGSDVFPNDPRPIAFVPDARFRDGSVEAELTGVGSAAGVVLRRCAPRCYYAAIYDTRRLALLIVRRHGGRLEELAAVPVLMAPVAPLTLRLSAEGSAPTTLRALLSGSGGRAISAVAIDRSPPHQKAGDAGVLATAETLFPSDREPVLPALGNLHLLPWSVQEGQAVMATPVGALVIDEIRRRSTARFRKVAIRSREPSRKTPPSVIAATSGAPVPGGARLHVATDLAARVELELSYSSRFRRSWRVPAGRTGRFNSVTQKVGGLEPGRRVWWRARLERGGQGEVGPARSFRVLPDGGGRARVAVASCGSQFGPIFESLAESDVDTFVWQGDLNYPDTHGPLAQSMSGYAGIWRDFLANPLLEPILSRATFAAQRDDHDYGVQDANAANVERYPFGLAPWEALVCDRTHYRFRAGAAEFWVLDQRRHKTDARLPDSREKTLLGMRQRRWLLRTLAASDAAFKVICSPCTVFLGGNARDGNWAAGYGAERDLILDHIRERVSGSTIFVTGDVHVTGVFDSDGVYEARAAPVGIPAPNDITLVDPLAASRLAARRGVTYADGRCHFALLDVSGRGRDAALELSLVREGDGVTYRRRFTSRPARLA
jgi:hypothetical protein